MAGLDSISGDVSADTTETPAPVAVKSAPVKMKSGLVLPTFSGATVLEDTGEGEGSVLAEMKRMIEERKAKQGSFLERIKDAQAWWSPTEQRAEALKSRGAERENQQAEIFNMQQTLAQYKAQQAAAQRDYGTLQNIVGGGGNVAGGELPTGTVGGGADTSDIPQSTKNLINFHLKNKDLASAKKAYADWASATGKKTSEANVSPENYKLQDVVIDGETKQKPLWWIKQNPQLFAEGTGNKVIGPAAQQPTGGKTDISAANIEQVESRGRPGAVGPLVPGQGRAQSSMQVMPATSDNPGFGVKPARLTGDATNDEAERKRVGTEYFNAMKERYKEPSLAAAAYVWGPGNLDKWIKGGAELSKLPKDVRDYVGQAAISGATFGRPNQFAAPQQSTSQQVVSQQGPRATSKEEAAAIGEARKKESGTMAESSAKRAETLVTNASSSLERSNVANNIIRIAGESPQAVGLLNKPGIQNALGIILKEGIKLGSIGQVGLPVIEDAMRRTMPNVSKQDIDNINELKGYLSRLELEYSKTFLQGQGAVSDNERRIVSNLGGSLSDSADTLRKKAILVKLRSDFDAKAGEAYGAYRDKFGEYAPFSKFERTAEYQQLKRDYDNQLANNTMFANDIKDGDKKSYPSSNKPAVPDDVQNIINKYKKKG